MIKETPMYIYPLFGLNVIRLNFGKAGIITYSLANKESVYCTIVKLYTNNIIYKVTGNVLCILEKLSKTKFLSTF